MKSFKYCFQRNFGIETDLQLTKDNKLAVFHDFHTFSLNGRKDLIKDISYNSLQRLSTKFKIPTLNNVLEFLPPNKEIHVEIKSNKIKLNFNHPVKELVWRKKDNVAATDSNEPVATGVTTYQLKLNGHDRFAAQEEEYFQLRQPYQYHTAIPNQYLPSYLEHSS